VLRVITRLNVGGPATHVILADRGLRARGWETLLAFGSVEPDEMEIDMADVDVPTARIPTMRRAIRPVADLRAAAAIAALIRRHRPDVIHSHLSKAGLIARSVALATRRPVRIHTFHGTVFGGYFGARASAGVVAVERFLGAHSNAVVALSSRQAQELLEHRIAPADRIAVVPLGLPLERFAGARGPGAAAQARRRLGITPDAVAVVAVGRLVPIKRLDRLIEAFAIVAASVPSARLYLIGDGTERGPLERLTSAMGLADRIVFAGWASNTPDWYAAADIVALSSDREGTPLVLIEAAASARAVVTTDVGGTADVVVDGRTGFVVPRDDIRGLADRVIRLAADPDLRADMGLAATGKAADYAADRLVEDLDRLYRRTLARDREAV
jgi:glycosyltransferase involved in cell wall biosynthesis